MKGLVVWFGVLTMVAAGLVACSDESAGPETYAWCEIDAPDNRGEFAAVSFPDPAIGTVVGDIYRTTDSGRTWSTQESPLGDGLYSDVVFTDENTGTIVGDEGTILRTTDGGETWVAQDGGTDATLRGVSFADASNGMVAGDEGTILHTTDGGASWAAQDSGSDSALFGVWLSDTETATATAVGAGGTILRTSDGGATWEPQDSGTQAPLRAVSFASTDTGVAVGGDGLILRTTDGGGTWVALDGFGTEPLNDVWFADANVGTIVGNAGTILRTTDAGATWVHEPTNASYLHWETLDSDPVRIFKTFYGVSMSDADNGVAVGGAPFSTVVLRAAVQDKFGACDPWCAKTEECFPDDVDGCDISCLCDLRYAYLISSACERAVADIQICLSTLTCEQIDAWFDDPESPLCMAATQRLEEVCS